MRVIPSRISEDGPEDRKAFQAVADHWAERGLERFLEDSDLGRALATWFALGYSDDELVDLLKIARLNAKGWSQDMAEADDTDPREDNNIPDDDGPEAA